MRRRLLLSLAVALPLLWAGDSTFAQKEKGRPRNSDAIFERARAFAAAFDKGDAREIAGFWTEDGDYIDQDGKRIKGRAEIQKAFEDFFAENKGARLRIDSETLRFVTPDVALEDGVTEVIPGDGSPPKRARYSIVHVNKDGKWHLSGVRDAPYTPPSNAERLRGLEGLIGEWEGEGTRGETAHLSFAWAPGKNFIVANYTTSLKGVNMGGGTQWIGWDPLAERVRSWSFETSGGFGEGTWAQARRTAGSTASRCPN